MHKREAMEVSEGRRAGREIMTVRDVRVSTVQAPHVGQGALIEKG
jgi:hypothetical protein